MGILTLFLAFPAAAEEGVRVRSSRPCGDAVCHRLEVRCGGIPAREVRVREHAVAEPVGAVVFATGVYGVQLYGDEPERRATLEAARAAGLETFEVEWGERRMGWGAHADGAGFTGALCGYAAVVRWLHAERADRPELLCAQGNSGGSLQIAYGLSVYGLEELLDLAVLSGGPPITRIDRYCFETKMAPHRRKEAYGLGMVDHLLGWRGRGDHCRRGEASEEVVAAALADSLVSPTRERDFDFPGTRVVFVESERDKSTREARDYHRAITSAKEWRELPGSAHGVDRTAGTAEEVRRAVVDGCRPR